MEVEQPDGMMEEFADKEGVEGAISAELSSRFGRAESSPLCNGDLFDLLGVYADTGTAAEILEGSFVPPPTTEPATAIVLEEMGRIWEQIGEGEVSVVVTREDFQYYWRRAKERTSSSLSDIHFGHYKALAHDDYLSSIMARKISITSRSGKAPSRWTRGLSGMISGPIHT